MQNREIYDAALRFLAESTTEGENEDYKERAPYLIAAACTRLSDLDTRIRHAEGKGPSKFNTVSLSLDVLFPLSDRLSPAVVLYLSSMLILESDEERSDKLYRQYLEAVQCIEDAYPATEKPGTSHSIIDKYF